jgi:ribose transport system substrate-binding protein
VNKVRTTLLPLSALALMIFASACGGNNAAPTATPAPAGNTSQATTPASNGGGDFTLGIVTIAANDFGNANVIKGATKAAEARGWKVQVVDAQGSADQANAAMKNLLQSGSDAILDLVFPVTSLQSGLQAAIDAKVPVATWGGGLGEGVVAQTGAGGPFAKLVGDQLVKDMGGKGSLLMLTYHTGLVCREREQVLDDILKQNPDIKVQKNEVPIPGQVQAGSQYASAWLASHPADSEKLAIWGCWEDPALGAASALRQQGRTDVLTYGENGGPEAINAIKEGQFTATAWEDSEKEGEMLVDTLDEAMKAAALRVLDVLVRVFGLTRVDAYSFMSVAVDFTVTQVVDQRQGVHGRIDKRCFPRWGGVGA